MRLTILALLFALIFAQHSLNYLSGRHDRVSVQDLVNKFTELQPQIYKKVFQHFMIEQIAGLRSKRQSQNQVKERVLQLLTDSKGPLLDLLTKYMQDRLFKKLEMGLLTPSLQAEILQNPENFYLTFDIYDLLFD